LFSSLGSSVEGARVLDLYAGTGATGIEALSRGAVHATFVERDRAALATLRDNLLRAKVAEAATVRPADVHRMLMGDDNDREPFDLVFVDPPYRTGASERADVLRELASRGALAAGWTLVLTRRTQSSTPVIPLHWRAARELRYGDSLLTLYQEV
jgi:16S rRNA (guanine966-N2)-methyltransferase